ncbi:NlpC/P60 family protein [Herbiconiux sp. CPCC 205716]|uniref:NlpC/P60 family protein n=1 Tax=Herbiconiux gentiana TaxID=2970912 RepID=A0ABT2GEP4_9MICO|nr:NlpC/P60 family protein [Herbiconiux gentiana]MCS5714701.1 NlpC/P60 family protein [Herbiconiux gentiana]
MAPLGDSLDNEQNPDNDRPEQPMTRRRLRELESQNSVAANSVAANVAPAAPSKDMVLAVPTPSAEAKATATALEVKKPAPVATQRPSIRTPRFTKPSKKSAGRAVVMTFAAALVATMALPAYAFGGGGNFESGVATDGELAGNQTLVVPDASAALAVSRDNYTAPTPEELQASRERAAAAVAATQAAAAREAAAASAATAAAAKGASSDGAFTVNPPSGAYSGAAVVEYAEQFVGKVPYGSGASPDTSFGCDGLTQYVFGQFGIYLPRLVSNQAAMGIPISPADAQAGDLIIWPIGHVGIYDGAGGSIDSPDWGRYVEHRPLWGSYYFVRIV